MSFSRIFHDAYDFSTFGSTITSATLASTYNQAAGDLIVVTLTWETAVGTLSVSDVANGSTFTAGTRVQANGQTKWVQLFYKLSSAASAVNNVTASWGGTGVDYVHLDVSVYRPSGTASYVGEATGSANSASQSTSSQTAGTLAFYVMGEFSGVSATAGSGWTAVWDTTANGSHGFDRIDAPGGSISGTSTTASAVDYAAAMMVFSDGGAGAPTITSTSTATPAPGDSVTLTGTSFGASQGAGYVTLGGTVQTVTAWGDTSITVTIVRGRAKYGTQAFVVRDNSLTASANYNVTLTPPAGWAYVDLSSIYGTAEWRIRTSPDLASGDQIAYQTAGDVVVEANATFSWTFGEIRYFDAEVWTAADGWGGVFTQYLAAALDLNQVSSLRLLPARRGGSLHKLNPNQWGFVALDGAEKWFAPELAAAAGAPSHSTTGALVAGSAAITGSAAHQHAATGALSAAAATIVGAAAHLTLHTTSGALSASAATISGTAEHQHAATGALSASAATISGTADHTVAGSGHATSGALTADAATISGTATHLTLHATTGALSAGSATITGAATHPHTTSGALVASSATLDGTSAHLTLHSSTGALSADAATIAASAVRSTPVTHATSGSLSAGSATLSGSALRFTPGSGINVDASITDENDTLVSTYRVQSWRIKKKAKGGPAGWVLQARAVDLSIRDDDDAVQSNASMQWPSVDMSADLADDEDTAVAVVTYAWPRVKPIRSLTSREQAIAEEVARIAAEQITARLWKQLGIRLKPD